ncbi:NUDIX hydrolase [Microbacterium sediminis]|uniref:DNA mismatch repair protein MutT n=1 Tax=Microbacterium sediminis TaxID=904291 RepID=A0A1B9N9X9_9MICO|nr:NUDIX hydrolase [Microbacterium sediminis]OCG73387.1 DNA mismatch repair protein MutT [Microbacterium sediminis]QBR72995.1 NUDIX domain-containing protein [Microbacterium sediminis]
MDLRVAAYAVITDDDGRVLLSRWIEGTKPAWTMPGGGMDPGEHPEDTARREVREETGYDVEIGEVLGVDSFVIPARKRLTADAPLQALRIVYRARIVGGHLAYEIDGSTDMAEWFPLDHVRGLEKTSLVGFALRAAGLIA